MKIFLDTEFTDFFNTYLISLGMVSESGEEFYVEIPYPEQYASEFVEKIVVPLLGQDPLAKCEIADLRKRILDWFLIIGDETDFEICFDYHMDWGLFNMALESDIPSFIKPRPLKSSELNEILLTQYFKDNNLPEHHALFDARANKFAFRELPDVAVLK